MTKPKVQPLVQVEDDAKLDLNGKPKTYTDKEIAKYALEAIEWFKENEAHYTPVQFLAAKGLPNDLFRRNQLVNPAHQDAVKKLQALCEARIISLATTARNPIFFMFILKAKHGYVEEEKRQNQAPQHVVHHHIPQAKLASLSTEQLADNIRQLTQG